MICIKSINGLSNGKWALTQTQANRPKKLIFGRKTKKICHPSLRFNNSIVSQSPYQKHLGIFLDARFTFEGHLKVITTKVNKTIGLFWKLQNFAKTGINDYIQSFCETTSRLWWYNLWWNLQRNNSQKIESIQYNACLVLSGAITGLPREKLYHELGLVFLQCRRWYRKLSLFYKIFKENKPVYLFNPIPTKIKITIPEIQTKLLHFILNINFSKILFFHPLSLNGISQILFSEVLLVLVFSKRICWSLLDHCQTVFLIVTTAKESN